MSVELLYTSAPQGLKQGSRGFCTVLSTQGMPVNLAQRLEGLSGYRHVFQPSHADVRLNPICYSHIKLTIAGRSVSILSRISDYGVDYSQRTNKLAHHLVLEPSEMPPAGPAWVLLQSKVMRCEWDGKCNTPSSGPNVPMQNQEPGICKEWARMVGDAGWGGVVAEALQKSGASKPLWIIFDVKQSTSLLKLVAEAIALLPPSERWRATFSTYCTNLPPEADCRVRCVLSGSEETRLVSTRGQVIDLTKPMGAATASDWVTAARSGIGPIARISASLKASDGATQNRKTSNTVANEDPDELGFELGPLTPRGHQASTSPPTLPGRSTRTAPPTPAHPSGPPLTLREDPFDTVERSYGKGEWNDDLWKTGKKSKGWNSPIVRYSLLATIGLILFGLVLGSGIIIGGRLASSPVRPKQESIKSADNLLVGPADLGSNSSEKGSPEKDSPEKDSPEKDSPEKGSPEKDSPEKGSPEKDSPEKDSPEKGSPEKGSPEKDSPEKDSPEKDSPEKGSPEKDSPEKGSPEKGSPEKGSPEKGSPESLKTDPSAAQSQATTTPIMGMPEGKTDSGESKSTETLVGTLQSGPLLKSGLVIIVFSLPNNLLLAANPKVTYAEECDINQSLGNLQSKASSSAANNRVTIRTEKGEHATECKSLYEKIEKTHNELLKRVTLLDPLNKVDKKWWYYDVIDNPAKKEHERSFIARCLNEGPSQELQDKTTQNQLDIKKQNLLTINQSETQVALIEKITNDLNTMDSDAIKIREHIKSIFALDILIDITVKNPSTKPKGKTGGIDITKKATTEPELRRFRIKLSKDHLD